MATRAAARASVAGLNALRSNFGGFPLIGNAQAQAPLSGYHDEHEYTQGLNEEGDDLAAEAEQAGRPAPTVRASYGGTNVASRASMDALHGFSVGNPVEEARLANNERINAMQEDADAQRRANPEYRAQWARSGARDAEAQRRANIEDDVTAADFDLGSGRAMAREKMTGDVKDEAQLGDARLKSKIYFDPAVQRQRNDEFYNRMEELRRRYVDPAAAKESGTIAAANIRAQGGVDRENVRGGFGLSEQDLRNQGGAATATIRGTDQIRASIAAAGGDPSKYVDDRGAQPPTSGGKTMSQAELESFARDKGMDPMHARALAVQNGYTIVR